MKPGLFKALCAALLIAMSAAAHAHRFHTSITDISYNARTKSTEVVHTYMAHDIEALLTNLYQRLKLRWIGMTIDAQSVVVFQEAEQTQLSQAAVIRQGVLIDFLPDQVNTVNLNEAGAVRSLTFMRQALEQAAR